MTAGPNIAALAPGPVTAVRKLFWRLLPFLFLVYIVNYLDRVNVGFAALQMQSKLGFSDRVYGLGAGIFFAGYFLFQIPSNFAMTRVGARRWIATIMVLWGVISACMIFVRTAHGLYELRLLLGATEAGFFPGVILYLKNWFPAGARARAIAMFMAAIPLSGVVGGPISGALLEVHLAPLAGWQWLFLIEAVPAVVLGLATLGILAESPESASWLSNDQRDWLIAELHREQASHPEAERHWLGAFVNVRTWLLILIYGGITTCMYGLVYFLPKMIRSVSSASNFEIGVLSTIPYLAATIAMILAAMHSDKSGERRKHLSFLAFAAAVAAWVAGFATSTVSLLPFLSIALAGALAMLGPFWAFSTDNLSATTAPAGIALINSLGNFGGFLGPYLVGRLHVTSDFRAPMMAIAVALISAGAIAALMRAPQRPAVSFRNPASQSN